MVINTDSSDEPGSHWIAVFQEIPGTLEIFDSFGRDLHFYGPMMAHLANGKRVISQTLQYQSNLSTVCGQHCMFFMLRRSMRELYARISHLFTGISKAMM